MKIDVSSILDEKGKRAHYRLAEIPGVLSVGGRDVRPTDPADIEVEAINVGGGVILVRGRAKARVPAICDRCLKPFTLPLEADFEEEYKRALRPREDADGPRGRDGGSESPAEGGPGEEGGCWAEDGAVRTFSGSEIQIRPAVQEALTLALPMKVVCREECKGLCPQCGKDLNLGPCCCRPVGADTRMAPLADLLKKIQLPEHEE